MVLPPAQRGVRLLPARLQPGAPATCADHAVGRKLYACFLAAGIPDPRAALVQPLCIAGEEKTLAWPTLEASAEAILSERLASEDEVSAALTALGHFTEDPQTLISGPRIFQLWSRR